MKPELFPESMDYYRETVVYPDLGDLLTSEQLADLIDTWEEHRNLVSKYDGLEEIGSTWMWSGNQITWTATERSKVVIYSEKPIGFPQVVRPDVGPARRRKRWFRR